MKILQVITDLNTGGVPLHLLRLARYLTNHGETVRVISLSPRGPVAQMLEDSGIPTQACDAAGAWDWRVAERLAATIGETQPDVVHSLLFHANIAARFACLLAGFDRRRLICEIQTVEIERRWHLLVDGWTQGLCRWIVGNSPSVIEHLACRAHIARPRLRLIRGGVDVDAIRSAEPIDRTILGIPAGDPLLLWVGRLDPVKGLDVLVEAATRVVRIHAAQIAIVGEGPYCPELKRLVTDSGIAERVHLLGPRDDVARLLKAADVFVFPSRTEGLPNAVLEAMAAGLPVVTTDAPGCRDLIEHDRTGLIVPVDNSAALAASICRLLSDGGLGTRLARAAAEYVSRNFRLEQCFGAYQALYHETTSARSAS